MVGQDLAESGEPHPPWPGFAQLGFEPRTDGQFADIAFPVFARSAALVAEATQVRTLVVTDILETGNVYAVCATAVDVFVVEAFEHAGSAVVERMIHHVVPQLAAATAQAALPNIGCGVHQYPGAIEGRSIEEDHF